MNNKAFDSKRIAMGYAKRPWLHENVTARLKKDCNFDLNYRFKNGLDVGCGAGLSTKALRLVCDKVTGTDIAETMIEACRELYGDDPAYDFYVAKAEETIIPDEKYDIITAAGCINWVDEKLFMDNVEKVLDETGLLLIYDFGITDRMIGDTDYTKWYQEYLWRFPKPARKERKWAQSDLPESFIMEKQIDYDMVYSFDLEQFVDFMLIQSNVNAQVENGIITTNKIRTWMEESLSPIFDNDRKQLVFCGYSWYIRRNRNICGVGKDKQQ